MTERLRLKKNADRRLKAGHLWLYSNEIDTDATPLKDFEPGGQAVIEAANGKPMGVAYVNPHSLICARIVSRDVDARTANATRAERTSKCAIVPRSLAPVASRPPRARRAIALAPSPSSIGSSNRTPSPAGRPRDERATPSTTNFASSTVVCAHSVIVEPGT